MEGAHGIEELGHYAEAEDAVGDFGRWAGDAVEGYGFEEGEEEVGVVGMVLCILGNGELVWGGDGG